jgi:ligand-binding SRPBCC domain-containing protein
MTRSPVTFDAPRQAVAFAGCRTLRRTQFIAVDIGTVFRFFSDAANLEVLTPPWLRFRILTALPIAMHTGARIAYRIRWRGVPVRWLTEILDWNPPHGFVDTQVSGPYRLWHHTHRFTDIEGGTRMEDVVQYRLPFGPLGSLVHAAIVHRDLQAIFDYRRDAVQRIFGS